MDNRKIHFLVTRVLEKKGIPIKIYKNIDCPVGLRDGTFLVETNYKKVTCKHCKKILKKGIQYNNLSKSTGVVL